MKIIYPGYICGDLIVVDSSHKTEDGKDQYLCYCRACKSRELITISEEDIVNNGIRDCGCRKKRVNNIICYGPIKGTHSDGKSEIVYNPFNYFTL